MSAKVILVVFALFGETWRQGPAATFPDFEKCDRARTAMRAVIVENLKITPGATGYAIRCMTMKPTLIADPI